MELSPSPSPPPPPQEPASKRAKIDLQEIFDTVTSALSKSLDEHDQNRIRELDKFRGICNELRKQIDTMEEDVIREFEERYTKEDNRLQSALHTLNEVSIQDVPDDDAMEKAIHRATAELTLKQQYRIDLVSNERHYKGKEDGRNFYLYVDSDDDDNNNDEDDDDDDDEEDFNRFLEERFTDDDENNIYFDDDDDDDGDDDFIEGNHGNDDRNVGNLIQKKQETNKIGRNILYKLYPIKAINDSFLDLTRPTILKLTNFREGRISVEFARNKDLENVLSENGFDDAISYIAVFSDKNGEEKRYDLKNDGEDSFYFTPDILEAESACTITIGMRFMKGLMVPGESKELIIPKFSECCVWNKIEYVERQIINEAGMICKRAFVGNVALPQGKVTSWNVVISKSKGNNGMGIKIGVGAPAEKRETHYDHGDKKSNYRYVCSSRGWYLDCFDLTLISGYPHNFKHKGYASNKALGQNVHTGDRVGVVMDMTKGELSFVLNGVNHGVAYEGIPLDKPLVPCVVLEDDDDSVELDLSEVKENVNPFLPIPTNLTAKKGDTWDSIKLKWDGVSNASFYQVEMNGNKIPNAPTSTSFTKTGLKEEDTEYSFRVRSVYGNEMSGWSEYAREKTQKREFKNIGWEGCPGDEFILSQDNVRVVTANINRNCFIRGNVPLMPDKVTSWNINILATRESSEKDFFVGIAQLNKIRHERYDFYLCCSDLTLVARRSVTRKYGPEKGDNDFVHSVGVVMDTKKGELSFIVNGVNYGVAFDDIPRGFIIFPSIVLKNRGDTVELDLSPAKENVDWTIPTPQNLRVVSGSWKSVGLSCDTVDNVNYQLEVNGSVQNPLSSNLFAYKKVVPNAEYSFRVRSVRGYSVSEWSDALRWRSMEKTFENNTWKECPRFTDEDRSYSVNEMNQRIVEKTGGPNENHYTTIICEMSIPQGRVSSWSIKVLKSIRDNSAKIYVGVAPYNINLNSGVNYKECGWYLDCYASALFSGPPHNYKRKEYGQKRGLGKHVHTGDSVGIVMDMTRGDLSFVLRGENFGVAYTGIPLDRPLVPCVVLYNIGDSVEFVK